MFVIPNHNATLIHGGKGGDGYTIDGFDALMITIFGVFLLGGLTFCCMLTCVRCRMQAGY